MKQFQVANTARGDLDEIWFYIAGDNPENADKLVRSISSRFAWLATTPKLGRLRKELAPRLRSFAVGNYVIVYRVIVKLALKLCACCRVPGIFRPYFNTSKPDRRAWCSRA